MPEADFPEGLRGGDFIHFSDKIPLMKKSTRLEALVEKLTGHAQIDAADCYRAYFLCFNDTKYYEAHDVLEYVWLKLPSEEGTFFKGLIQLAGAFVHFQKQYFRPHHYKFEGRLKPAKRLLWCTSKNLQPYLPKHRQLNIATVLKICEFLEGKIVANGYQYNPWRPEFAPKFEEKEGIWRLKMFGVEDS